MKILREKELKLELLKQQEGKGEMLKSMTTLYTEDPELKASINFKNNSRDTSGSNEIEKLHEELSDIKSYLKKNTSEVGFGGSAIGKIVPKTTN